MSPTRWAPGSSILKIDTLFRTPMIVGTTVVCRGAVTGINDDDTIAFRNGPGSVYINHMQGGGCLNIDSGRNTLVTRTPGPNLCRGDIAQIVDLGAHIPVGSCVFGDFVPYRRVG